MLSAAKKEILSLCVVGFLSLFPFLSTGTGKGPVFQQFNFADPATIVTGMIAILLALPWFLLFVAAMATNGEYPRNLFDLPAGQEQQFRMNPPWRRFLDVYLWALTLGQTRESKEPSWLAEAVVPGIFGGVVAGFAAHYLAGGKMNFPVFLVAYLLILYRLRGWRTLVGLVVFTAVAVVVIQYLGSGR
jgi:hypothetical protein